MATAATAGYALLVLASVVAYVWGLGEMVSWTGYFDEISECTPAPCDYFGDERHECACSMGMVQRYQKRISSPILDRIDIHPDVHSIVQCADRWHPHDHLPTITLCLSLKLTIGSENGILLLPYPEERSLC